jgi:hypothetical protein
MKTFKTLLLAAALIVVPAVGFAGNAQDDDNNQDDTGDATLPAVPEPGGALLMSVALATAAFAARRSR